MDEPAPAAFQLADRVAAVAQDLGIESAVIGAVAMAAHNYVRATMDIDLATAVNVYPDLQRLADRLRETGLSVDLRVPDEDDPLGGALRVWESEDDHGEPLDPVEVVNFRNPFKPRVTPAPAAITGAVPVAPGASLRYVQLPDLIALKLYAGGLRDHADIVDLLVRNPDADLDEIRARAGHFGERGKLEELIELARRTR